MWIRLRKKYECPQGVWEPGAHDVPDDIAKVLLDSDLAIQATPPPPKPPRPPKPVIKKPRKKK